MKSLLALAASIVVGALPAGSSSATPHQFVGPIDFATAESPSEVWVADVNGDGKRDVVTVGDSSEVASVLLGKGDGSFETKRSYKTGVVADCADFGDLNGDGRGDLVVGDSDDASVSVLLSTGDGGFGRAHVYDTGGALQGIEIADMNGSGRPDLFTIDAAPGSEDEDIEDDDEEPGISGIASVLVNRGDGRFGSRRDTELEHDWNAYTLADVDRDGALDLVTANDDENSVSVLLNSGGGSFRASTDYATGELPEDVAVRDLNGDARPDLAVVDYAGSDDESDAGSVSVLLNRGGGTFGARHDYDVGEEPVSLLAADVSGDGKTDLTTSHSDGGTISVLVNRGDGSFAARRAFRSGDTFGPLAQTDLNGDGSPEVVALSDYETDEVRVLLNDGHGGFPSKLDLETGIAPRDVAFGDLNGDDRRDLVVADYGQNAVSVFLNTMGSGKRFVAPTVVFPHADAYVAGTTIESVALGDLNHDGRQDVVTTNRLAGTVTVLLGRRDGFGEARAYPVGRAPYWAAIGDLDGDGAPDLAAVSTRDDVVSILLNAGNGTFKAKRDYRTGHRPYAVAIGDLDGDGAADLVVGDAGPMNGLTVSVLLNAGDGSFPSRRAYRMPRAPISVALADLNGDGRLDIATANHLRRSVSVLLNVGGGTFGPRRDYRVGRFPRAVAIGDMNGDRAPDLAVATTRDDRVSVLLNAGDGTFAERRDYRSPGAPSSVAIADFDGDGAADLATGDADGLTLRVLPGDGKGTFGEPLEYPLPGRPGFLAAGDLDGDGATDVVATSFSSVTVQLNATSGG